MADDHVLLKIDTSKPVALTDFVALFVGVGNQFERFTTRSNELSEARFFVKEVRAGCIEAELVALFGGSVTLAGTMTAVKYANDLVKFVENFGGRLRHYFQPGGRDPEAGKSDLSDFLKTVQGIAADPDSRLALSAATYEDGQRAIKANFSFGAAEAREAERQLIAHQRELVSTTASDYERVLMSFVRTDVGHAKPGARSKDRVRIDTISARALPIVYASDLAEQRVRHEIAEADENVYKKAFDVDVNVELRDGKPIAYRVVAVHDVIDPPDDDELDFTPLT